MHDKGPLKDQTNSLVQGGSHCLPLGGSNQERSLKTKTSPAGIPQKWYPWKAWKMRKRVVQFVLHFGFDLKGMQRREDEKKKGVFVVGNEEERSKRFIRVG